MSRNLPYTIGSSSINGLTLGNLSSNISLSSGQLSSLSNDDVFTFDFGISPNVRKYEIYEFSEDVLALSVTWNRMRAHGINTVFKLTDNELFNNILPEDRTLANTIANYYSKKIMILKLIDNTKLSSYRKDLNEFIHSDRKKVVDKMFGLAYHLPAFYDYDILLDQVKSDLITKHDWNNQKNKQHGKQQSLVLVPIKRLRRKTKNLDTYQYWLKTTNGTGVLISLQFNNILLKLWEHFFNKNEPIVIAGTTLCKNLDGFEYLSIKNWEIVHS